MDANPPGVLQLLSVLAVYMVGIPLLAVSVDLHHVRIRAELLFHTGCVLFFEEERKIG